MTTPPQHLPQGEGADSTRNRRPKFWSVGVVSKSRMEHVMGADIDSGIDIDIDISIEILTSNYIDIAVA